MTYVPLAELKLSKQDLKIALTGLSFERVNNIPENLNIRLDNKFEREFEELLKKASENKFKL